MELRRRSALIYGLLIGVWLLVVGWQIEEHDRIKGAAKSDLRNRSREIADTLSATVRALRFRETVLQSRLEPVLDELVNARSNELGYSSGVISIALLNTNSDPIVAAGDTNLIPPAAALTEGELWTADDVTFINPVWGASISSENESNATVVLPLFREFSNSIPPGVRFERRESGTNEMFIQSPPGATNHFPTNDEAGAMGPPPPAPGEENPPAPPPNDTNGGPHHYALVERHGGPRRPPWMRWMSEDQFKALTARRELHGLVLTMSTENLRAVCADDLLLRGIIVFFAGLSAIGVGLAWRYISKTSELQIRLVRASELNSHLKEMNLAAAGLAHETRNPLNIIRGMAQMISRTDAPADIREKSRAIVDETDKVTAQLNEFINYSRPREVRRAKVALNAVVAEVVRALNYDIEEKKIRVETAMDPLYIEADEQLLRQALFNLLLNAIQAVPQNGQIQFIARKDSASSASLDIRDNGPGVPPEQRAQIFKPYFTTHQKGTGLGLAVVQQIGKAHGWEIECLANEPQGAVFRISHLGTAA